MSQTYSNPSKVDTTKIAMGKNTNGILMPLSSDKYMNAAGGILSTTKDMLNYMQFHLNETHKTTAISHQHLWGGKYGDFEAGLFWQINKNGTHPDIVFQNGGAFGTSSWLTLIPEQNIGVFIVTNISGPDIHKQLELTVTQLIHEIEHNTHTP